MSISSKLWRDDSGFVVSSELVLLSTILVVPMVVGMQTVRDSVVQELGDVGQALGSVVQSYSYSGVVGHYSFAPGSRFFDQADQGENNLGFCAWGNDRNCVSVGVPSALESGVSGGGGLIPPVASGAKPLVWDSGIRPGPPLLAP